MNTKFLAMTVPIFAFAALPVARAGQFDLPAPTYSSLFGTSVIVLPNGNFVVTDPGWAAGGGGIANAGAVYLYDGITLAVISTLTGSNANDKVGSGGVTVLSNGNYVVSSPHWINGAAADAGAVTWCNGTTGLIGTVAAANSLVFNNPQDMVSSIYFTALNNGNYVLQAQYCDTGVTDGGR